MSINFKYPFHVKDADPKGTQEALVFLREFYTRYPTGNEWAEAIHQLRRELNLIKEVEEKRKRVAKIQQEIDELENDE